MKTIGIGRARDDGNREGKEYSHRGNTYCIYTVNTAGQTGRIGKAEMTLGIVKVRQASKQE